MKISSRLVRVLFVTAVVLSAINSFFIVPPMLSAFAQDVTADVIEPKDVPTAAIFVVTDVDGVAVTTPVSGTKTDLTMDEAIKSARDGYDALKDGKVLAGLGVLLSLLLTGLLRFIQFAARNPAFMSAPWFRKGIPIFTFVLSLAITIVLALTKTLTAEEMVTSVVAIGTGAIAWWETVGQHFFKKPKERAQPVEVDSTATTGGAQ